MYAFSGNQKFAGYEYGVYRLKMSSISRNEHFRPQNVVFAESHALVVPGVGPYFLLITHGLESDSGVMHNHTFQVA